MFCNGTQLSQSLLVYCQSICCTNTSNQTRHFGMSSDTLCGLLCQLQFCVLFMSFSHVVVFLFHNSLLKLNVFFFFIIRLVWKLRDLWWWGAKPARRAPFPTPTTPISVAPTAPVGFFTERWWLSAPQPRTRCVEAACLGKDHFHRVFPKLHSPFTQAVTDHVRSTGDK